MSKQYDYRDENGNFLDYFYLVDELTKYGNEIEQLNDVYDKLEYWLKMEWQYNVDVNEAYAEAIENTLNRLKELREGK